MLNNLTFFLINNLISKFFENVYSLNFIIKFGYLENDHLKKYITLNVKQLVVKVKNKVLIIAGKSIVAL